MKQKHGARILIADDHRLLAEACKKMLEPEFEVVGIVTDGRALVRAALELRPDVAIIDVGLPYLNGLDAAERIRRNKLISVKLIFLTVNSDPEVAAEAFRRGASGYVLKHSGAEEFISAIHKVLHRESYLSPLIARETLSYLLNQSAQQAVEKKITTRQAEILQLLAEGHLMKQIADTLAIAPATVAFHKYRMMERLGTPTNADLLRYAIRHHMISG
jgi:DNA-binding NarL/FixJ family response regulator